ncbi:hypothetical protein IWQ60_011708 [Tieghemiomyces parasiticus]|uniref:RRM domain-containing protein n=1 Tax=Tieghemiomyces parasiticus TaxID=78921 RepID=A0A9W7ZMN9_9FUNG|nr:hypothetical protein IWQ60_011708 [Tieghemiomyces parasiticus]
MADPNKSTYDPAAYAAAHNYDPNAAYNYDPNAAYYYGAYQNTSADHLAAYYASAAGPAVPAHHPSVAAPTIGPVLSSGHVGPSDAKSSEAPVGGKKAKKRKALRAAGGELWEDNTLDEWDTNDFRLFAGDLGNEVTDELLTRVFGKYPSFLKARVVRDKKTDKSRGYGFISFRDPNDFSKAWREMNGKYVGNRPIKLRKSTWKERNVDAKRLKKGDILLLPAHRQ